MSSPKISLCVIARDEQETLPRCLQSAGDWVDEMIVVDTGSEDATPGLARRHGARVDSFPWADDFAAARNAGLDRCRGTYVLVLDADEWIADGPEPDRLHDLLLRGEQEAFSVELIDQLDGGAERRYPLVRLFRNRPEHRYRGAIHEQITPAIADRLGCEAIDPIPSGLSIGHDGYRLDRRQAKDKAERNLRLLRRWVEREPDDVSARYFLARELTPVRQGRAVPGSHLKESLPHFEWLAARERQLGQALAADAARLHAAALLALQRTDEAWIVLEERADQGVAAELLRADVEMLRSDRQPEPLRRALARVEACFDRETRDRGPVSEPALAGPIARARAAELLGALGDHEQARKLCEQAIPMPGAGATPWSSLAAIHVGESDLKAAMECMLHGVRADSADPWVWAGLGTLLLMAGRPRDALEPLVNALRLAPGWHEVERMQAFALESAGEKVGA